jgi:hypothetical protein
MVSKRGKKAARKAGPQKKPARKRAAQKRVPKAVFAPAVPPKPVKPKKNYKLPNYKKKCIECAQFKFIKGGWSLCMQCYEKRYGKYQGEDRFLYVPK